VVAWSRPLLPAAIAAQTSRWKGKGRQPRAANHASAGADVSVTAPRYQTAARSLTD
jgi:hypothetical protein